MSLHAVFESLATIALCGWAFIAWLLMGRVARCLGTGRLQVLGGVALAGWLLGR